MVRHKIGSIAVWFVPPLALLGLILSAGDYVALSQLFLLALLFSCVLTAIHHAEVVAHRVGEPFGTLTLALAITTIEVGLILSIMLAGTGHEMLARDTIFSALMLICTGIVGLCLTVGSVKYGELAFKTAGATSALTALTVLAGICLVLPNYTTSAPGPLYVRGQLLFVAITSAVVWASFVWLQSGKHRDYFLPEEMELDHSTHAQLPSVKMTLFSVFALLTSLISVVGLAKLTSPRIEEVVRSAGLPVATLPVLIAFIVLLPETGAALRAAARKRLQTSMNLALGSALASIGLTIPAVVVAAILLNQPIALGIEPKHTAILAITLFVNALTFILAKANLLLGVVHLVLCATFLVTIILP
ncbi:hypothetical protein QPK87_18770 [Kamptonema cortianum]|nr:hypothetical protein [Geitlerinema splendidum]MDK3158598.1 hypothetical protein [Kamptonema cortianum]